MTTRLTDSPSARTRIANLRHEIALATRQYRTAKMAGNSAQASKFLRLRTQLIEQLFQAQREFLASMRKREPDPATVPGNERAICG